MEKILSNEKVEIVLVTELIDSMIIPSRNGKKNLKIEIRRLKEGADSYQVFLDNQERLTPKSIELIYKENPKLMMDEDFPLLVLSENLYGDPAVVEICYVCNNLKFNSQNLEDYKKPLVAGTKFAKIC